ncbi:DEAD-domain-containing protein, partial [Lichtheimia hyalospora FSU 10163]
QTFDDLGLQPSVIDAVRQGYLKHVQDARPSEIQALSIPSLLKPEQHRNVLVAAETGSGKTLAYLLPVIDQLKRNEKKPSQRRRLDHPRAIVLVPTRELVTQVVQTAKSLAHVTKFRALGADSKVKRRRLAEQLEQPVDVLVATPTTLCSLVRDGTLSLADTRHLVVDEADSLFDAGWGDDVRFIMDRVGTAQCIIVSATLPRSVHRTLDTLFGERLLKLTTPSLHRALPNLKQSFIDLARFNGNRQLALLDVLKRNIKDDKTLVFCNTRKSAQLLHDWLGSKDMPVLALHKDAERSEILTRFACQDENASPGDNVLISTDIASRGIDTTFVDHVVLYDFPSSVVDYLHRVGRTARAGRTGKATSLVGRKDK